MKKIATALILAFVCAAAYAQDELVFNKIPSQMDGYGKFEIHNGIFDGATLIVMEKNYLQAVNALQDLNDDAAALGYKTYSELFQDENNLLPEYEENKKEHIKNNANDFKNNSVYVFEHSFIISEFRTKEDRYGMTRLIQGMPTNKKGKFDGKEQIISIALTPFFVRDIIVNKSDNYFQQR